jgi:AhpD family alkylhydroperoxidase
MNESKSNPWKFFLDEAPAAAGAFNGLVEAVSNSPGLDAKTSQLIYIAMKAANGDAGAVVAHTGMAKKAGVSRDELKAAILMTLTVSGVSGVVSCLEPALSAWEAAL